MESNHKSDYGKFVLTAGKFYGDADKDKGEYCIVKHCNARRQLVFICGIHRLALFYVKVLRGEATACDVTAVPFCAASMSKHLKFTVFQNIIKPHVL